MLKNIAERKKNFLSNLPQDPGGAVKELQNYEFMDPEAQHKFTELMEMLKKAMTETFFKNMYDQIANMSPEEMARIKQMVKDLNQMLSDRLAGGEPDFEGFMQKYGDLFGDNPPQSLDDLVERMQMQAAQMQNLLDSLPGDMRQQLQDLLSDKIGDPDLQAELSRAADEPRVPVADARHAQPVPVPRRRRSRPQRGDGPDGPHAVDGRPGARSSSARSTAATSTTSTRRSCASCSATKPRRRSISSRSSSRCSRSRATSAARATTTS